MFFLLSALVFRLQVYIAVRFKDYFDITYELPTDHLTKNAPSECDPEEEVPSVREAGNCKRGLNHFRGPVIGSPADARSISDNHINDVTQIQAVPMRTQNGTAMNDLQNLPSISEESENSPTYKECNDKEEFYEGPVSESNYEYSHNGNGFKVSDKNVFVFKYKEKNLNSDLGNSNDPAQINQDSDNNTNEIKEENKQEIEHKDDTKKKNVIKEIIEEVSETTYIYKEIVVVNADKKDVEAKRSESLIISEKDKNETTNIFSKESEIEEMKKIINQGITKDAKDKGRILLDLGDAGKDIKANMESTINKEIMKEKENNENKENENQIDKIDNEIGLKTENVKELIYNKDDGIEEMKKIINQEIAKKEKENKKIIMDLSWEIIEVAVGSSGTTAKVFSDSVYESEINISKFEEKIKSSDEINREAELEEMKEIEHQGNFKEKVNILIDIKDKNKEKSIDKNNKESNEEIIKPIFYNSVKENHDKGVTQDAISKEYINNLNEQEKEIDEIEDIRNIINQGITKETNEKGKILINLEELSREINKTTTPNNEGDDKYNKNVAGGFAKEVISDKTNNKNEETFLSNKEKEMKAWKLKIMTNEKIEKKSEEILKYEEGRKQEELELNCSEEKNVVEEKIQSVNANESEDILNKENKEKDSELFLKAKYDEEKEEKKRKEAYKEIDIKKINDYSDADEIVEMKKIINQEGYNKHEEIKTKTEKVDNNWRDTIEKIVKAPSSADVNQGCSKVNKSDVATEAIKEETIKPTIVGANSEENLHEFYYTNIKGFCENEDFIQEDMTSEITDAFEVRNILDTSEDDVLKVLMNTEDMSDCHHTMSNFKDDATCSNPFESTSNDSMILTMETDLLKEEINKSRENNVYIFKYTNEEDLCKTDKPLNSPGIEKDNVETLLKSTDKKFNSINVTKPNVNKSLISNLNVIISVATVHAESPNSSWVEEIKDPCLLSPIQVDYPYGKLDIKKSRSFDASWLRSDNDDFFKVLKAEGSLFDNKENKNYISPLEVDESCGKKKTRKSVSFDASFLIKYPKDESTSENKLDSPDANKDAVPDDMKDIKITSLNYEGEDIFKVLETGCDMRNDEVASKDFIDFYKTLETIPVPPLRRKKFPSVPMLNNYDEINGKFDDVKLVYSNSELEIIPPPRRKLLQRKQLLLSKQKRIQNPLIMNGGCKSYSLSDINAFDSEDIDFFDDIRSDNKFTTSVDDSVLSSKVDSAFTSRISHTFLDDSTLGLKSHSFMSAEASNDLIKSSRTHYNTKGLRASVAILEGRRLSDPECKPKISKTTSRVKKKSYTFTKGDIYLNEIRDGVKIKKKSKSVVSMIRRTFSLKEINKSHSENPSCLPNLFKRYKKRKRHSHCNLKNLPPIREEPDLTRCATHESFKSIFVRNEEEDAAYAEKCIGYCGRNMSCVSLTFPDLPDAFRRKSSSSIDVSQYASTSTFKTSGPFQNESISSLPKGPLHRRLKEITHEYSSASLDAQSLKKAKELLDKSLVEKSTEKSYITKISDSPKFGNISFLPKGSLPRYLLKEFNRRNSSASLDPQNLKRAENLLDKSLDLKSNEEPSIPKACEPSRLKNTFHGSLSSYLGKKVSRGNRSASLDTQTLSLTNGMWNKLLDSKADVQKSDTPVPPKRSKSKQSLNSGSMTSLDDKSLYEGSQPETQPFIEPLNILKSMHEKHNSPESFKSIFTSSNDIEKVDNKPKENIPSSIFDIQELSKNYSELSKDETISKSSIFHIQENMKESNDEIITKPLILDVQDTKNELSKKEVTPETLCNLDHEHGDIQQKRLDYLKKEIKSLEHISHKIHDLHDAQEDYHEKVMRSFIRRYSHDIEALSESKGKLEELTNMYQINAEENEEEMEKVASKEILGFDKIDDISINKLNLLDPGKRRESLGLIPSLPSLKEGNIMFGFSCKDNSDNDEQLDSDSDKKWKVYKLPCKTSPDFVNKETLIKECLDGTFRLKLLNFVKSFKAKVDTDLPERTSNELSGQNNHETSNEFSENYNQVIDDSEDIRRFAKKYELDLMTFFEIKGKNFLQLADTEITQRRPSIFNFRNRINSYDEECTVKEGNTKIDYDEYPKTERETSLLSPKILSSVNAEGYVFETSPFQGKFNGELSKTQDLKLKKKVSISEPEIIINKNDQFYPVGEESESELSDNDDNDTNVNKGGSMKYQKDFDSFLHAPAYQSLAEELNKLANHEYQKNFQDPAEKVNTDISDDTNHELHSNSTNIETLGKEYEVEVLSQIKNIIPQVENRLRNISKFSYLNMKINKHGLIDNSQMLKSSKLTKRYSEDFPRTILPKYPFKKRTSLDVGNLYLNGFNNSAGSIPDWFKFQPLSLTKLASNVYFRNRKLEMFSTMMDTSESINKFILSLTNTEKTVKDIQPSSTLEIFDINCYEKPVSPITDRRLRPSIQHLIVARRDSTITYESSRPDSPIPTDVDPNSEMQFHETLCISRSPILIKKNVYHFPYFEYDTDNSNIDSVDSLLNETGAQKNKQLSSEESAELSINKVVPNQLTNRKFIISPVSSETFNFSDIPEVEEIEETQISKSDCMPNCLSQLSLHRENSKCKSMMCRSDTFDGGSSCLNNIPESPNHELNVIDETKNSFTSHVSERERVEDSTPTNFDERQVLDEKLNTANEPKLIYNEFSDSSESLPSVEDEATVRHFSEVTNTIKDKCSLNCECQFHSDESDSVKILALHEKSESPEYVLRTWHQRQEDPEGPRTPSPVNIPKWVKENYQLSESEFASRKDTPSPGPPTENLSKLSAQSSGESENNSKKEEDRTQKDRCVEIYPETIRQRQRNMAPSPSKVDIKNWEPSAESNEEDKKFLPSVKALRNQFESGKAKAGSNTLVRTSSDSSTNSLVLNSLDTSSGFGSLTSSQVTLEQSSSGPMPSPKEYEEESVEPIFSQFREADDELKDMMSKPPSTQGWNPSSLLKRLYYVPDAPKIHRREAPFVNIEGYLEKLPSGRKKATFWNAWKRRYFVAKDGILYYYQNNQTEKANMKLPLMGGKIEIMDPSMISVEDGGRESRNVGMLGIDDGKGHYVVVRCTTRQEAERWKQALETHTLDDFSSHYIQPWPRSTNPTLLRDTIVIDIGSCSVRAGVLTSQPTLPQLFFPSVVATNRETKAQIWGIEALMPDVRPTSSITFPIRPSHKISKFSVDLNAVSSLLQKTFNDLKVDPQNYNIQLSVPRVLNPNTQTELLKILFDKFGVKAVNMTHQSILALYAYNATSGIIVDIGERLDVVPVIDGYIVDGGVSRVPYGGYRILDHLRQFLFQKNISLLTEIDSYIIRQLLENICYCAQHYNTEKQRCTLNPENFEKLASLAEFFPEDSQYEAFRRLTLDFGRFQSTEGLFNPDAWGLDHPGLHKLVHKAIQECSMDIRKELSRSIFLVGGVTQLPGIADRLTVELDNLTPPAIRPKVHASPYRYHASYLGACILAESDAFAQSKITKEEWTKQGNSSLRKWAL